MKEESAKSLKKKLNKTLYVIVAVSTRLVWLA